MDEMRTFYLPAAELAGGAFRLPLWQLDPDATNGSTLTSPVLGGTVRAYATRGQALAAAGRGVLPELGIALGPNATIEVEVPADDGYALGSLDDDDLLHLHGKVLVEIVRRGAPRSLTDHARVTPRAFTGDERCAPIVAEHEDRLNHIEAGLRAAGDCPLTGSGDRPV